MSIESSQPPETAPASHPSLIDLVEQERKTVGSTAAYVSSLAHSYLVPEHHGNLLQMQRTAAFITNPNQKDGAATARTNGFYWGQILGYTFAERLFSHSGMLWSNIHYKLQSEIMAGMLQLMQDFNATTGQDRQTIADGMVGELECLDGTDIPPLLDQYIDERARELTQNPQQQHFIILGFRQVIRPVITASTGDVAIQNEFFEIMQESGVDDAPMPETPWETLPRLKDDFLELLSDRMITYSEMPGTADIVSIVTEQKDIDPQDYADFLDYIDLQLARAVLKHPTLHFQDTLQISNTAMYFTHSETAPFSTLHSLPEGYNLIGSFDSITVLEVPTNETFEQFRRRDITDLEGDTAFGINPFGLAVVLTNGEIVSADGTRQPLPQDMPISVVLNYPRTEFARLIVPYPESE